MKPDIDPQKIEYRAQYMYLADTANGGIHCNRYPAWSELSESDKADYRRRARRNLEDER